MQNIKSNKADLENKKGIFFIVGLVISLGLVLLAFEWKTEPKEVINLGIFNVTPEDYYYVPPTPNEEKKLPPKPVVVPFLELVDNNSEIIESPDLFNTEPTDEGLFNFDELVYTPHENKFEKEEEIFVVVEESPEFPGGELALQKYLASSLKYPLIAQENGIQGKVYVSFVIDQNGFISEVTLVRGIDASLDNEALRVVRTLPRWKPGKQGGKAVKVRYYVPINFELQ